jgi:hypothetical protein
MTGTNPESQPETAQSPWERLLRQTEAFAAQQAAVRWWRHAHDGVMPDGYDPSSIAAQALSEVLQQREPTPSSHLTDAQILQLQNQLERLVCKIVDRLRHRKENFLLRNEPDLAPVFIDDGEPVSIIETIPDPSPNPAQTLLQNEHTAEVNLRQDRFEASLTKDRPLKILFANLRRGFSAPRVLARKLKITTEAVHNLKKRLKRKWDRFANHEETANHR